MVAEVEYESWAEELRLCGSEDTLIRPSENRVLPFPTDLPSPVPLIKLGVPLECEFIEPAVLAFRLRGLFGILLSPRGGCGNELMLTDFRSVFPGIPLTAAETERGCNNAEPGVPAVGGGSSVEEGVRSPVLGVEVRDRAGVDGGCRPDALRVLATGSAGRAIVGGPFEGLEGFWSAVVIL